MLEYCMAMYIDDFILLYCGYLQNIMCHKIITYISVIVVYLMLLIVYRCPVDHATSF